MKKWLSIILALVIALSVLPLSVMAGTSGDYTYEVLSEADKTCVITAYTGKTRNLTIPSSLDGYKVVELGALSFQEAKLLKTVIIPSTVTVIRESAFFGCLDLTTVAIPSSVKVIEQCAFAECTELSAINFPDSVTFIGRGVLHNTKYMPVIEFEREELILPRSESLYDTSGWTNGELYIGKHLIGVDLKKTGSFTVKDGTKTIAGEAFYWCDRITSVSIPNSVVTVGEYAFYQCSGLKNVTLPESVTTIARGAFDLCNNLQTINIPSGVKEISAWAFAGCKALKSVTIPGTVEKIGTGAYNSCTSLTTVKINSGVKEIGKAAFYGCTALSSITIADSVNKIGQIAFGTTKYYNTSANWSNNALYIGNHLIGVKGSVSGEYSIKAGTKAIAEDAFYECKSITGINFPSSVSGVWEGAFRKCSSLQKFTVASDNNNFSAENGVLYNKNKTELICCPIANSQTTVSAPSSVNSVWNYAFYECANVKEVKLSGNLQSIGTYAFYNCGKLEKVRIPASTNYIGEWAFVTPKKVKLVVAQGSYAEDYAKNNDLSYEYAGAYYEDKTFGIIVESNVQNVLPTDGVLVVSKKTVDNKTTYSINIKKDNAVVQPTGTVTVKIPMTQPSGLQEYKAFVGNQEIVATYENGYLIFETTKLGEFVVEVETKQGLLGDSNGDGKVSSIDARWVLQVAAGTRVATEEEKARMDANGSGTITAIDARWILQAVAGTREL